MCTGCTACESACLQKCISMKVDDMGNYFPEVCRDNCTNCGLCEKACPINRQIQTYNPTEGYVARYKDKNILHDSNSGGFFSAIADYVIQRKGAVYGAGLDSCHRVRHMCVDKSNIHDLAKLRGSKYVQSNLSGIYKDIRKKLQNDELVCFSGTPCQVAGLRSYLGKDYKSLICIDLVCHGVASPIYFEKYIHYMVKKYDSDISEIKFRNKTYGYHSGTMKITFNNKKVYYGSGRVDYFLKAYYAGAVYREACYNCKFKGLERYGDFTIFDSWHVNQLIDGIIDDDKGYTNVYVNTGKAKKIINELKTELEIYSADVFEMKKLDGRMIDKSFPKANCREKILKDMNADFESTVKNYLKVTKKDYIVEMAKSLVYRFKIYKYFSYKRR